MTIKRYLAGYLRARDLAERYKREAEEIETIITSAAIDYTRARVQTSPQGDRWAEAIDKLINLHEAIAEATAEALEEAEKIQRDIDGVRDPVLREILFRRWIQGQTMEEIAEGMHRDLRWIYRLHARALRMVDHVHAMQK